MIFLVSFQPPSLEALKRHVDVALRDISEMWCLGTWFSGGPVNVSFTVGLNDPKGFSQSKWFYDPTTWFQA